MGISLKPKKGCKLKHDTSSSVEILTKVMEGEKSDDPSQFVIKPKNVTYGEERLESLRSTGFKVKRKGEFYSLSMSNNSLALGLSKKVYER